MYPEQGMNSCSGTGGGRISSLRRMPKALETQATLAPRGFGDELPRASSRGDAISVGMLNRTSEGQ
jgi:hypothetical protein